MVAVNRKPRGIDDRIPLAARRATGRVVEVPRHNQIGLRIPEQYPGLLLRRNRQKPESIRLENQHTGHVSRRRVDDEKIILPRLASRRGYSVLKRQTLQIVQTI